jgi:Ala-tRNA(Pro) deacylase
MPEAVVPHATAGALSAYLTAHGVVHEVIEHAPTFRAGDEARASGVSPDATAKTVVVTDGGAYMLVILPASERLDLHKVRDVLGASRTPRLATEEEIAEHFSPFAPGAVPPVGSEIFAGEIVDRGLAEQGAVVCAGGDHRHAIRMSPSDIVRLAGARVADVCEE